MYILYRFNSGGDSSNLETIDIVPQIITPVESTTVMSPMPNLGISSLRSTVRRSLIRTTSANYIQQPLNGSVPLRRAASMITTGIVHIKQSESVVANQESRVITLEMASVIEV